MLNSKLPKNIKIHDSINEFDKNLPETVKLLNTPEGSKIYVIGTTHFGEKSKDDVSLVIRNVKPDILVLELCHLRVDILKLDEKTLKREASYIDRRKIFDVIQQFGILNGGFYLYLLKTSANFSRQLGEAPGGECRRALKEIKEFFPNCKILLGDRPIDITIQRAVHNMTISQKMLFLYHLVRPHYKNETKAITQENVETLKNREIIEPKSKHEKTSSDIFSSIHNTFVNERDLFLANSLHFAATSQKQSNGSIKPINVVGVVGIGHLNGICENWIRLEPEKLKNYLVVPSPTFSKLIVRSSIKCGVLAIFSFCAYKYLESKSSTEK